MDQPAVLEKYRMQSKVILTTTALLILIPAVIFIFLNLTGLSGRDGARVSGLLYSSL